MQIDRTTNEHLNDMLTAAPDKRTAFFVEQTKQQQKIWILKDDDGAVMLTSDEEDCIPVWSSQEAANLWKNAEWSNCECHAISFAEWFPRWTKGMQEDELCIAVFPIPGEDGLVVMPDEFEHMLS